jgi:hypothetical protein
LSKEIHELLQAYKSVSPYIEDDDKLHMTYYIIMTGAIHDKVEEIQKNLKSINNLTNS